MNTLRHLLHDLDRGHTSAAHLTEATLQAIHAQNPHLNAYITVDDEGARAQALQADQDRANGQAGPLCGVPIAVKDIILTRGLRTTAASRMLANFIPPYDATVVERLRQAGAVIIGKASCDAFAMGSSNEHSAFGPVQNPAAPGCIPGGSSGGSAAAVAAHLCAAALGTDTGGSIRQPASHCGIVGLKPTYGRVSRFGVVAFASSLDQVGPMARTTWDAARLLEVIAGFDPRDSTSSNQPTEPWAQRVAQTTPDDLRGRRVGVPRQYFTDGIQPEVEAAVRAAIDHLQRAGAHIIDIDLPHTPHAVAAYYLLCTAEASSNLARYDGMRYGHRADDADDLHDTYARSRAQGFGAEVKRRIILGTYALSTGYYDAYYLRAQKVRTLIRQDFERAFQQVDLIATPTAPTTAFPFGAHQTDPLSMYLSDIFTISCNLAGLPGLSLPCGQDKQARPIGLQLLAPWFHEGDLLAAAAAYEQLRDA